MLATGVALTIIPTEPRPLLKMPRPQVGSFDPQAERPITVSLIPIRNPGRPARAGKSWPLLGPSRFRFRFD